MQGNHVVTDTVPRPFEVAIAYCLAYDQQVGAPTTEIIEHFSELAQACLAPPETDAPEGIRQHLQALQQKADMWGDPKFALVMGGATKIKQYVFESSKLPEIRGASALLDEINLTELPALFSSEPNGHTPHSETDVRQRVAAEFHLELPDCRDCVIYANGGELFAFAPVSIAPKLADAIEWLYTQGTRVANSVAAWRPFSMVELAGGLDPLAFWERWERADCRAALSQLVQVQLAAEPCQQKRFGELAAVLSRDKSRRRDGNPMAIPLTGEPRRSRSVAHVETLPYGERCRSCERRVASRDFPVAGERQLVCAPCYIKLESGWTQKRRWVSEFENFLIARRQQGEMLPYGAGDHRRSASPVQAFDDVTPPQDLNEIGQASRPSGYIGVVYADANNMGAALEALATPSDYATFAEAIFNANQQEVFRALSQHLQPIRIRRKDRQGQMVDIWSHPFEILSIGGDDLFLIVPAHAALPIAHQIAQGVETRLAEIDLFRHQETYTASAVHRCVIDPSAVPTIQSKIALSAGVLLADAHTPIFFLQELVEQLLKSAKTRAKALKAQHYRGGSIDFMALKSMTMITSLLSEFRDSTYRVGPDRLISRPYTLMELAALLDTVRALKQSRFPRSQLYALRNALSRGRLASTVDYLYFSQRLGKTNRQQLRQVLDDRWCRGQVAPWRKMAQESWETVLFDILEIYDFVPVKEAS